MHVPAVTAAPVHVYYGPARLAADNDGDGRKGAVALNDGDVSRAGIDGDLETRDWSLERGTPRSCHDRGSTRMS